jgi:acyl carrier protein
MDAIQIKEIMCDVLKSEEPQQWTEDYNFLSDGKIDSLDMATLAFLLEEKTGIKVADTDLEKLSSINNILSILTKN